MWCCRRRWRAEPGWSVWTGSVALAARINNVPAGDIGAAVQAITAYAIDRMPDSISRRLQQLTARG